MLDLYIVRHGQTEWNLEGKFQGWLNSPLTTAGIDSAKKLGEHFKTIDFEAFYTSPLERAKQTLEIAIGDGGNIICDERIKEICLGRWQGMLISDIQKHYPEEYKSYYFSPESFQIEGGESYFDLYSRVTSFLNDIQMRHFENGKKKKILVVTHGITLMMLQLIFGGETIEKLTRYQVPNNSQVHVYRFDGSEYSCLGDVSL